MNILSCPHCQGELELKMATDNDEEIVDGTLLCVSCGRSYQIEDGIPNLLPH